MMVADASHWGRRTLVLETIHENFFSPQSPAMGSVAPLNHSFE